jgi:hypothetical protein
LEKFLSEAKDDILMEKSEVRSHTATSTSKLSKENLHKLMRSQNVKMGPGI